MTKYIVAYVAAALVFFALDMVWLGYVARDFYKVQLGGLLLAQPKLLAAGLFYSIYVIGIVIFGVTPAIAANAWIKAMLFGGLFGFFAYLTYDMSNLATLRDWPLSIVIVDILWGTFVTAVSATFAYLATTIIKT